MKRGGSSFPGGSCERAVPRYQRARQPGLPLTIQPPERESNAGWIHRPGQVPDAGVATQCIHGGVQPDPAYGAVMPPLYLSSTFTFKDICTNPGNDYTRGGNPTPAALEEAVALLEGGHAGLNHGLRRFRWFTLAESLGGVESLVAHPASLTPEARQRAGNPIAPSPLLGSPQL